MAIVFFHAHPVVQVQRHARRVRGTSLPAFREHRNGGDAEAGDAQPRCRAGGPSDSSEQPTRSPARRPARPAQHPCEPAMARPGRCAVWGSFQQACAGATGRVRRHRDRTALRGALRRGRKLGAHGRRAAESLPGCQYHRPESAACFVDSSQSAISPRACGRPLIRGCLSCPLLSPSAIEGPPLRRCSLEATAGGHAP